jgi:hypothetical protein
MQSSTNKLQRIKHGVWKVECEMQIIEHEAWVQSMKCFNRVLMRNTNNKVGNK